MVNTNTGVDFGIYTNMFLKYGDTVTHYAATKTTSNISGDETITYAAAATFNAYIARKDAKWFLDKPGYLEGGDAIMLVKSSITVNKEDKIVWNSNTYRIVAVINRDMLGGNVAYKSCQLFLI